MLVVVLQKLCGNGEAKESEVLGAKALAQLLVGIQEDVVLPTPLNRQIRSVVGIEAGSVVIEDEAVDQRRPPVDDPAFFWA